MNYYNEHDPKAAAWLRELIQAGEIPPGEVDERSIVNVQPADLVRFAQCHFFAGIGGFNERWDKMEKEEQCSGTRNKRDVWNVAPANYTGAHFATYPPDLIKPCILAGCPVGGTVLDPFGGSGTTGAVALELGRNAILMELNPEYIPLIQKRTNVTKGLAL